MQLKISSEQKLLVVILVGVVLFAIFFYFFIYKISIQHKPIPLIISTPVSVATEQPEKINYGIPERLKIPNIKIDAKIESVGLTASGAMDTPKNPDEVAWYMLGTRPGEIGSAVIVGHYGIRKNGKASIFDDLDKLQQGDKISIEDDKGQIVNFIVRESRLYNPKANASDVFGSNDGKSHLNFVTCEGIWSKIFESYPKRLVVFTDKE